MDLLRLIRQTLITAQSENTIITENYLVTEEGHRIEFPRNSENEEILEEYVSQLETDLEDLTLEEDFESWLSRVWLNLGNVLPDGKEIKLTTSRKDPDPDRAELENQIPHRIYSNIGCYIESLMLKETSFALSCLFVRMQMQGVMKVKSEPEIGPSGVVILEQKEWTLVGIAEKLAKLAEAPNKLSSEITPPISVPLSE